MYEIKDRIFSPAYREMIRNLKKMIREDQKDEVKLDDIRTSEGAGRKGPASRAPSVPKSRHRRRNSGENTGQVDYEAQEDSNP